MLKPNNTELVILKLLWKREPRTAREIHDEIEADFSWSYSSTRKTLERMADKGLLNVGEQGNKKYLLRQLRKYPHLLRVPKSLLNLYLSWMDRFLLRCLRIAVLLKLKS